MATRFAGLMPVTALPLENPLFWRYFRIMIYFFADNHYDVHPGRVIFERLPERLRRRIRFDEDDWSRLEAGDWLADCELVVLHLIGGTCGVEHPGAGAERAMRAWCEKGGDLLLLHGASAAFWQWPWWRKIVGFRWVRPGDPDGVVPSTHPKHPCRVEVSKVRHPLAKLLRPLELPCDEIYINLEQVSPAVTLMETRIEEGTFPECFEAHTPWGGRVLSFLPGQIPEVAGDPALVADISILIDYLLAERTR